MKMAMTPARLSAFAIIIALAACGDSTTDSCVDTFAPCNGGSDGGTEGDPCSSHDDCSGELYCSGPDDPAICGAAPQEDCATDADCLDGDVCHAIQDFCSPDGVGSQCRAA